MKTNASGEATAGDPAKAFDSDEEASNGKGKKKKKKKKGEDTSAAKSPKSPKVGRNSFLDATVNSELKIPQTEMFDMFQAHRYKILNWLRANVEEANEVMESVVRVVTRTGTREPPLSQATYKPRLWVELEQLRGIGRFVPDTEATADAKKGPVEDDAEVQNEEHDEFKEEELDPISGKDLSKYDMNKSFEDWYRDLTTQSVDTEINIQIGEFTLKKHRMQILEAAWMRFRDFQLIFGNK